jgi:hypothetical protein
MGRMVILARFSDLPRAETTAALGLTGCKGDEPLHASGLRILSGLLLFTNDFQSKIQESLALRGFRAVIGKLVIPI